MITHSMVYWITRLDNFIGFCNVCIVLSVLALVGFFLFCVANADEDLSFLKRAKILLVIIMCIAIFSAFVRCLLPSTKEACAIYLIPKIVNNEEVKKLPDNLLKLINVKTEQWINEQLKGGEEE